MESIKITLYFIGEIKILGLLNSLSWSPAALINSGNS